MALGDDVLKGVLFFQFLPEILLPADIPEGFHCPDRLPRFVFKNGRGNAYGHALTPGVDDVDRPVHYFPARFFGVAEDTLPVADVGFKDLPAELADGVLSGHAGNLLGGAVEGGDPPVVIHGKDTVGDGIKNRVDADGHFHGS